MTTNRFETEFTAKQLDAIAERLDYRDWTFALLQQRIAELDATLAAGDMPILETVDAAALPLPPTVDGVTNAPETDAFAAFLDA